MQIDKWAANVRLVVVDGTDPVSLALEVAGGKVPSDKIADAVGAAIQKQLMQLSGHGSADKAELEKLRDKVRVLEEANEAAKMAEVMPAPAPAPRKPGRPRKAK